MTNINTSTNLILDIPYNTQLKYHTMIDNTPQKILTQNIKTEIVSQNAEGLTQPTIANNLDISQSSVSKHLAKPESKELSERLRDTLQKKHVHRFISRVVKTEKIAAQVNDYVLGLSDNNPTQYKDVDEIEKLLSRVDRTGLAILKGVGILDTSTIYLGNDNSQHLTVTPAFQGYLDYSSKRKLDPEGEEIIEADV